MPDISALLANAAQTNANFDLGQLNKSYFEGQNQQAALDLRNAFKGGVPPDANGQPDFNAIARTLFQKGALDQGLAATKLGLEQQRLKYGMDASKADFPTGQPSIVSPPSVNRRETATVAPPINTNNNPVSKLSAPSGGTTLMQVLDAQGIPNDQLEAASASVARQLGVSPTDPVDITDPQIRNVLVPAIAQLKRMGIGQVVPQGQAAPQPQTIPSVAGARQPATDPTLGGLVPPGRTPEQQLELLTRRRASGLLTAEQDKAYADRIKALQDALQPTPDMKNARAAGMTTREYIDRNDTAATDRAVLTTSILPKLDKSQDTATAARDEILAIDRAREQLDMPGGIFSGSGAEVRNKLAKVGTLFGLDDSKIANTEAFGSAIGTRVLSLVKNLGSGTAISNADREFAAAMAGGNIKLNEKSIRRILDIGEKAARARIDQHNSLVDRTVGQNDSLSQYKKTYHIDAPGKYAAPDAYQKARDAIERGAPRDAVVLRLQKAGFDPGRL